MNATRVGSLAIIVCLSGCARPTFTDSVLRYEGENLARINARFGAPDQSRELPGEPIRVEHTWQIQDRNGTHVCDLTAVADKQSGRVLRVSDTCKNIVRSSRAVAK